MLKLSRLLNRIQEKLETEKKGTVFQNMQPSMDIVILIYGTEEMDFEREIQELKMLAVSENCVLNLGCSRICSFPKGLESVWKEARMAADYLTGTGIFAVREYQESMTGIHLRENFHLESALYSAVLLGNIVSVENQLIKWAEHGNGSISLYDWTSARGLGWLLCYVSKMGAGSRNHR